MALGKLSALYADLSGKIGGGVHARNASGQYVRQWAKPINAQTTAQTNVRAIMAANAQAFAALDPAEIAAWNSAAKLLSKKNRIGTHISMSGIAYFTEVNNNLMKVAFAPVTVPPARVGLTALTLLTLTADSVAPTMSMAFGPSPVAANEALYIEATPQLSPGISYVKNRFRAIGNVAAAATTPASLHTMYVAKYGDLIAGLKITIRVTVINTDTGESSTPYSTSAIVS